MKTSNPEKNLGWSKSRRVTVNPDTTNKNKDKNKNPDTRRKKIKQALSQRDQGFIARWSVIRILFRWHVFLVQGPAPVVFKSFLEF